MNFLTHNSRFLFNQQFTLTAEKILAYGTTATQIGTIPSGGVLFSAAICKKQAFTGTSTDVVINVGTTLADPDECIDALNISTLPKAAYNTGDVLVNSAAGYIINNTANPIPIYIKIAGTLTTAGVTGGEFNILLGISDINEI